MRRSRQRDRLVTDGDRTPVVARATHFSVVTVWRVIHPVRTSSARLAGPSSWNSRIRPRPSTWALRLLPDTKNPATMLVWSFRWDHRRAEPSIRFTRRLGLLPWA